MIKLFFFLIACALFTSCEVAVLNGPSSALDTTDQQSNLPELPNDPRLSPTQCEPDKMGSVPKFAIRRLSTRELDNVASALSGKKVSYSQDFALARDGASHSFNQLPENLSLPDPDALLKAAEKFSLDVLNSSWMNLCTSNQDQFGTCTQTIAREFASRAFRYVLSAEESNSSLNRVRQNLQSSTITNANGHRETLKSFFQHVYLSPEFLYQYDAVNIKGERDDWVLASRLSFFFSSSLPDESLWEDVESGLVRKNFDKHIDRFLNNEALVESFTKEFAGQWLGSLNGDNLENPALSQLINRELVLVIKDFIVNDRDIRDLFDPGFTYVNNELAQHYGLKGSYTGWTKVRTRSRGGLLAMGAFLSKTQARPTPRGQLLLSNLLCRPLGSPVGIDINAIERKDTLRATISQLWDNPSCMSCHALADPAGFGLEQYSDSGKQVSTNVWGDPINMSGWLGNAKFESTDELAQILKNHPAYTSCVSEHLYSFANARVTNDSGDSCRIKAIKDNVDQGSITFKRLIREVLLSDEFQGRN